MTDVFSADHFRDDSAARKFLEGLRWPEGPVCPHCGSIGKAYATSKAGVYRCGEKECRKDFTVTTKSVMESSHIPLHKWLQGFFLMTASKKGISAHQLHRTIGVTYKSAWFMAHRIREAMRTGGLAPMGGGGGFVEADETRFGRLEGYSGRRFRPTYGSNAHLNCILSLVERGGEARSFHVEGATIAQLGPIIRANISREARLMTDEWNAYRSIGRDFASHESVHHASKEYVRGRVHINTAEGLFSIFKRGMKGVYQHCSEKHLHRYLAEFDFRYNNRVRLGIGDGERAARAIKGASGKRLTYRQPCSSNIPF